MNSTTDEAGDPVEGFLSAMRRLAATITLITTREDGSRHGMAATAVSSLTANPPSLLACINRSTSLHGPVSRVKWFCVNLLEQGQGQLFSEFIGRSGGDRFRVGEWRDGPHGLPLLQGAAANVFCSVDQQLEYRTHTIFIGRVASARVARDGIPLIYQDGGMGRFLPIVPPPAIKFGQVIYQVSDLSRAIAFYCDQLGLKVKFRDGDAWAALDVAGSTLALESGVSSRPARPMQMSLKVGQDFDSLVERLRRGGVTMGEITLGAHERTITVVDPDGNTTMLYSALRP